MTIRYSFEIDSFEYRRMYMYHDAELMKRFLDRYIKSAKAKLIDQVFETGQFLEIKKDENAEFFDDRHVYHLTLRVAQKT